MDTLRGILAVLLSFLFGKEWYYAHPWFGGRELLRTQGTPRSPGWEKLEKATVAAHPYCSGCGKKDELEVHHKAPFHLFPMKELDPTNLIVLCRDCHFFLGHFKNWKHFNSAVDKDSNYFLTNIEAKI